MSANNGLPGEDLAIVLLKDLNNSLLKANPNIP